MTQPARSLAAVERVTRNPAAHEQLLYFTSSSLTADDRQLIFISDRTGHPNLFALDIATGHELQLTDNNQGYLQSYVYFDGHRDAGLGKASVSLHAPTGTVYYIQGRQIRVTDLAGHSRTLAEIPSGQVTAFTHVSDDGSRLCVPTTDARVWDDDLISAGNLGVTIDRRVQEEKLNSHLRVYDTSTGKLVLNETVPCGWVTHVQFAPGHPERILYNHEYAADCGIRRMWLWDGSRHIRLRPEAPGRSRRDWVCHEMWERDGSAIIYHGSFADGGPAYIGRLDMTSGQIREIPVQAGWREYGHFTTGRPGQLVSDGYYKDPAIAPGDPKTPHGWSGKWVSTIEIDWPAGTMQWTPLALSGSSWKTQDEHPHPIFDHACRYVYFTSDREGHRAVYRVPTPKNLVL